MADGVDEEWVAALRGEHESEKEWTIKRSFIVAHYDKYEKERLICLANCFINMELYGCRYPQEVMHEVNGLAAQLSEIDEYRRERREREANRIKFVQGSAENKKRKSEDAPSTSKAKFPVFVSAGQMKSSQPEEKQAMDFDEGTSQPQTNVKPTTNAPQTHKLTDLRAKLNSSNKTSQYDKLKVTINNADSHSSFDDTHMSRVVTASDPQCSRDSFNVNDATTKTHTGAGISDRVMHVSQTRPALLMEYREVYTKMEGLIMLIPSAIHRVLTLDAADPSRSFIVMSEGSSVSTLTNSLSQAKFYLEPRQENGHYELTLESLVVARIPENRALQLISSLEVGKTRLKRVATLLMHKLLNYIMPRAWILIRKDLSDASQAVTTDGIQGAPEQVGTNSKGLAMLKSLGWTEGSGLGSHGQGIKEPVAVETTINRQGIGFGDADRNLKKWATEYFSSYMREGRTDVLVFSSEFSSDDRKILHQVSLKFGLKSQSRGKGEKRCLTVTRKGIALGIQIKQLVDAGVYDSDWCTIIPPGSQVIWAERNSTT